MTKLIYKSPLFRPAELLEQINQYGVQIELAKAVSPTGDINGYIGWLRFASEEQFANIYELHKCVLDESGQCPVCVVHYQRKDKQVVQQMPSGVEVPTPDSVVKGYACPEDGGVIKEHSLSRVRYCTTCDWSSDKCNHHTEPAPQNISGSVEYFPRCIKCGRWV